MDPERYQRLKKLMIEAMERPPDQRERFIEQACGDDSEMRSELVRLLGHSISDDFLANSALTVDEQQQTESMIGARIGRIRIDRLIARGGMGEVYAGQDELLERTVAIKLIRNQWRWSEARREAFLAEARALSALAHPNICQVHDFFSDADRDVLVMEFIEGRTLREILATDGRPDRRTTLIWAQQITDALVSAHEQGVAHRDLKPDNVMLADNGRIKVLDFGLARSLTTGEQARGEAHAAEAAGTPGYLAPEQALGRPATPASDLWSFGLLLIELLTGEAPYDIRKPGPALVDQARRGEVRTPKGQPTAETRLLRALLSVDPGQRPSAREVRDQLRSILNRPKRRLMAGTGLAALLLLTIGGLRYTIDLQNERNRAEAARVEAEELAQFMLQDLYSGLDAVGRLDLLEPVADKSIDYFVTRRAARGLSAPIDLGTGLALMRSSQVMFYQGRLVDAIEAMETSVGVLQRLDQAPTGDPEVQSHLIEGLIDLASQLNSAGHHEASLARAREAIDRAESLKRQVDQTSDRPESMHRTSWDLLLRSWYALSDSALRAGDFGLSIDSANRALALIEDRAPDLELIEERRADLSWTRCLALLQRVEPDGQIEACRIPLELDRASHALDPVSATARLNLSNSLWLMSQAQLLEGNPTTALEYAERAEVLARELIAWDPEQPRHVNQLTVILISQARALAALEREDRKQSILDEALTLTEALVGKGEDHLFVHNHATVLALLNRAEQARPWARILMDSGWNRPGFIRLCQSLSLDPRCEEFEF